MSIFWTTAGDDWIKQRNAYITSQIGADPSQSIGGGQNPMDMDQGTLTRIGEAQQDYQKKWDALEQQWFASLPPDQAKQAYDAFAARSADFDKSWKIGKALSLGTIGAIAGAGALGLGGAGAAGASGTPGVTAAQIAGAAGSPELGLAAQTGLTGATGAAGTAGAAGAGSTGLGGASTLPFWDAGGGLFGSQSAIDAAAGAGATGLGSSVFSPATMGSIGAGVGGLGSYNLQGFGDLAGGVASGIGSAVGGSGGAGVPSKGGFFDSLGSLGAKDWAGILTPLVGAGLQSYTANSAADKQAQAAADATALQKRMYDETVARNQPFVSGGTQAFNSLLDRLGLSGNTQAEGYGSFGKVPTAQDVMAEPGYQFGLEQGQKALDRTTNMRGMRYSGAALKAANRYGNDYATGQYNNAFNRGQQAQQQAYNQLSGVANTGQAAANNTSAYGANFANNAAQNTMGAGNANAANSIAQGNIWTNAINQGVSAYRNAGNPTSSDDRMKLLRDLIGG